MKQLILTLKLSLLAVLVFAQEDYYKPAYNLSGEELKTALHQIIDDHKEFPYTASSTDVWDILKETDKDPSNPNNVILIYSGRSVDAAQEYNSGKGWTREHVWAKSRGDFGTDEGAGTDIHHLRPCDNSINSTRNNRNFDECITCKDVIDEGQDTGSDYDENLWTFEPRDEVKGDVARMIFYMVIRYEGTNGELDLELQNELLDRSDKSPYHSKLSVLLEWHNQDPVDAFENNRNEVIFNYQGNRNPLIDYPDLVEFIWGERSTWSWNPETSINNVTTDFTIYPNPTPGVLNITFEYESIEITEVATGKVTKLNRSQQTDISNLPKGVYVIRFNDSQIDNSVFSIVKE